jgi:hypothetical protein
MLYSEQQAKAVGVQKENEHMDHTVYEWETSR